MLIERLGRREAENRIAEAQDKLDELVFAYEPFCKTAHKYEPSEGKTFGEFLDWLIIRRRIDVVRAMVDPPGVVEMDAETLLDAMVTETSDDQVDRKVACLRDCLDRLKEQSRPQIPTLGVEARAVFELRHKVYIDPANMASETFGLVRSRGANDPKQADQLSIDYEHDCQRLDELEVKLEAAKRDLDKWTAIVYWRRWELEGLGYSVERLLELEQAAFETTNDELSELERDFMSCLRNYRKAERHLENLLVQRAPWQQFRLPWVRSESVVGEMIGLPQPRVARRLAFAMKFLRDCLEERC